MEHATAGIRDEAARAEAQGSADGGRPLRVAMLASMFPPSIGGIQIHTLRLSQKLVERGLDVHVVTRIQPGLAPFERMCGVRVHRVGLPAARGAAGSLAFVAEGVRALLRLAEHVDVLHAHQLLSPSTIGLLASPLTGLPLVVNPHACGAIGDVAVLSGSRAGRLRLRAIVARADAFVAVSRTIRDELAGVGAPPQAIWSISNGVDTDRFCPAPPRERLMIRRALDLPDAPLVVYTGRLAPEKGVDLLLDAWARLAARLPAARLCVVGTGGEEAALRERARALGIAAAVVFTGGAADVAPYLRAADAAVLPSRTEGMPVALLEAMSCALPVVATRVGGSAEVLEDGVTGRLVPPEDPQALAAGIEEALRDDLAGTRRGEAARAHVLGRYAMEQVAERFTALYRAVTARHAARALPVAPGAPSR